jgi:hypothetical protein
VQVTTRGERGAPDAGRQPLSGPDRGVDAVAFSLVKGQRVEEEVPAEQDVGMLDIAGPPGEGWERLGSPR